MLSTATLVSGDQLIILEQFLAASAACSAGDCFLVVGKGEPGL